MPDSPPTGSPTAPELWSSQPLITDSETSFSTWNEKDEAHSYAHKRNFVSDKYLRGSVLGQGGWSVVYKVKRVKDGKLFAGKASASVEQLNHEARMLRRFAHNHILKYVEVYRQGNNPKSDILITELCEEGNLNTRIHHVPGGMGKREILVVTSQMADALAFLHEKDIFHSDIKPRNILIRRLNPIDTVLADCADCKIHGKYNGPAGGTPKYWSPEMAVDGRHAGKSDDIWAFGISLLCMMVQAPQMESTNNSKRDASKYTKRCIEHVQELMRLNPENGLVALAENMLIRTARHRITAEVCYHQATAHLERMDEDDEDGEASESKGTEGLQIRSPEEFKPVSFW
ncbi:kinase-like protein [Trichoderma barbatum]